MSPEDLKILQDRVNKNSTPKKDKASYVDKALASVPVGVEKVAKLASHKKNKGSAAKGEMELVIKAMFPDYEKEVAFCPTRRFRFDWMVRIHQESGEVLLVGIEYEGVFGSEKSRHTAPVTYTTDTEKYNLAQILGYKVLRYTALSHSRLGSDLWQLKYGVNE